MNELIDNQGQHSRAGSAGGKSRILMWIAAIIGIALVAFLVARARQNQMPVGPDKAQAQMPSSRGDQSLSDSYSAADSFVINGDFELSSDREAVDNWTIEGEARDNPTRSDLSSKYGSYSLRLADANDKSQAEVYQDITSPNDLVGKSFTFYSWIKLPDGSDNRKVTVRVLDGSRDYVYQPVVTDQWELYSFSATVLPRDSKEGKEGSEKDSKVENLRLVLNVSPPGDMQDQGEAFFDGTKLSVASSR